MTIKQLTKVVNGRLVPSNESVDADIIEVSKEVGNALEVKEDGLFYKEKGTLDGIVVKEGSLGLEDEGISLNKLEKVSSTASKTIVPEDTLQSLEEHLANVYSLLKDLKGVTDTTNGQTLYSLQALSSGFDNLQERLVRDYYPKGYVDQLDASKADITDLQQFYTKTETDSEIDQGLLDYDQFVAFEKYQLKTDPTTSVTLYGANGVLSIKPKIFTAVVVANSDGDWSVNYASAGFTQVPMVVATGQSVGTAAADRRFASLNPSQPTLTGCSGKLASATSAGLLAAMTMVAGAGNVNVVAIGF